MANRLFFRDWLVLALLLVPTLITAQEVTEAVDSIEVDPYEGMIIETYYTNSGELANDTIYLDDEVSEWQKNLPQYDFKECENVDICMGNPKYAIVSKNQKKGLFDLEWKRNITEVEFDDIGFAKQTVAEDSTFISLFYAKKGIKRGIVSLYEPTNNVVSIWMDDPDELYSLDECTTIDKKMTKKAAKLLGNMMKQKQMDNLQIVVLDAKSGRLKTWIRLDQDREKDEAGKLLVHSCTGSLTKPFHTVMALENDSLSLDSICGASTYRHAIKRVDDDVMYQVIMNGYRRSVADRKWRELTDTGNPSTSPFILAVGYNSLANGGTMIIPTMKADSVNVEENVFTETNLINLREVLRVDRVESPQLAWLTTDTDWFGYATSENIYADDDKEKKQPVGKQLQFAGLFPVENPLYSICIVADKNSLDASPAELGDAVNPLVKWLLKR
jgi:hypothetical protein